MGAYSSSRASTGAGRAHAGCDESRTVRVATTPAASFPSITLASVRHPEDTHFDSIGTVCAAPEGLGTARGAKSISFPPPVRR
jgi:hypothetical protein